MKLFSWDVKSSLLLEPVVYNIVILFHGNAVKYRVVSEKSGHGVMALIVIGNTIKICLQV